MPGIGVITNPKAKKNLRRPWIKDSLQRIVGDAGWVYETRSIDELTGLAHEFIDKGIEILAVNGGDGTAHIALTYFIPIFQKLNKPLPKVLSLRGGTMNTISNSIRHKGKGEDILSNIVKKYKNKEPIEQIRQPILRIVNQDGKARYGFMWGYGVVGNFLELYYKGTSLGPWQAFKTFASISASALFRTPLAKQVFSKCPSVVELDGIKLDLPDAIGALGCSIIEVGLGIKTNYRAYEKPGYVHLRMVSMPASEFVFWVPRMAGGIPIPDKRVLDEIAKEIHCTTRNQPPYTIDGELYKDANEFFVTQGPVLNVIREGNKKLTKEIGLPEDWETRMLPEKIEQEPAAKNYGGMDAEKFLSL